jgi:hypothetical protein
MQKMFVIHYYINKQILDSYLGGQFYGGGNREAREKPRRKLLTNFIT